MRASKYRNRILWLITCFLFVTSVKSQLGAFIHIQSENNRAYYIQWEGNTYTSTTTGYLIIPQVPSGVHTLLIGFPGTASPEYSFSCMIDDKPRGFSLKQAIDNSWSLFDMVSFAVIKGINLPKETKSTLVIKAQEPYKKQEFVADTSVKNSLVPLVNNIQPVMKERKIETGSIQKIFDKPSASGIDQVYVILNKGKADTIALFIPTLKEDMPNPAAYYQKTNEKNRQNYPFIDLWDGILPLVIQPLAFK